MIDRTEHGIDDVRRPPMLSSYELRLSPDDLADGLPIDPPRGAVDTHQDVPLLSDTARLDAAHLLPLIPQ